MITAHVVLRGQLASLHSVRDALGKGLIRGESGSSPSLGRYIVRSYGEPARPPAPARAPARVRHRPRPGRRRAAGRLDVGAADAGRACRAARTDLAGED